MPRPVQKKLFIAVKNTKQTSEFVSFPHFNPNLIFETKFGGGPQGSAIRVCSIVLHLPHCGTANTCKKFYSIGPSLLLLS